MDDSKSEIRNYQIALRERVPPTKSVQFDISDISDLRFAIDHFQNTCPIKENLCPEL